MRMLQWLCIPRPGPHLHGMDELANLTAELAEALRLLEGSHAVLPLRLPPNLPLRPAVPHGALAARTMVDMVG